MAFLKEYPRSRNRRLRQHEWIRDMVAESRLDISDLVQPIFITEGKTEEVKCMPGVKRYNLEDAVVFAREVVMLGIKAIALFPVVAETKKCNKGKEALSPDNLMCRAIRAMKAEVPELGIIADVALDPYTAHGHDGLVNKRGEVDNDQTIDVLVEQALNQVRAGCDVISPSDMMDGRVGKIRTVLDDHGFEQTILLAYAAKYASSFYGPFRDALGSKNCLGKTDKKTYQQDYANSDEAMHEIAMDIREGADWIMIKPGMPYLDIVRRAYDTFRVPISVYQVSGEYTMLFELSKVSDTPFMDLMVESLVSIKRAGARNIFCYASVELARSILR